MEVVNGVFGESKVLGDGGRLILMFLLQGLLNYTSVFPETIADLSFGLTDVLCVTFGALDHVDDVSRFAANALSYLSFSPLEKKV